ncbi:MAG: PAS domain S-box protein [Rubrobacteraceae bacterium]
MRVPLKVLIVEDSENDTLLLARELRRGGYDPDYRRVETAVEMESALAEEGWDLVVSDHSMPEFSSLAALELLRAKGFVDLPFIIVSGRIGEDTAVEAMKAGAQDYIMKDNLVRLTSAIERELREAEVRRKRRQAEEALQESEERFRSMVQYASDLIIVLDAEGVVTYESPAVERILGYTPEERIGGKAFDLLHPEDAARLAETFAAYADRPGHHPTVAEYRVRAKDGTWRNIEAVANNLLDEPSVGGIVVNARDVTGRKRAEENYRGIFENAVEGIFQSSIDGRLLTANPAMARMLGYKSPEELLESVSNLAEQLYVRPEHREEFKRMVERQGSVSGFETWMYRKDKNELPVSLSARALLDSQGELAGYEGMMLDITGRKRAEEALREIREAERHRIARELHDGVLQDLTYTLQSLRTMLRVAGDDKWGEERDRQVEFLQKAVGGLRDAIYDLRIEKVQEQPFVHSIELLVDLNRQMSPEQEINLVVEDGFPISLAGGRSMEVVRIVQEALTNIRRHSAARNAVITLGSKGEDLRVEVRDDGRGFDSSSRGVGIIGMEERALALDGELEVWSNGRAGTRVRLRVPLATVEKDPSDPAKA